MTFISAGFRGTSWGRRGRWSSFTTTARSLSTSYNHPSTCLTWLSLKRMNIYCLVARINLQQSGCLCITLWIKVCQLMFTKLWQAFCCWCLVMQPYLQFCLLNVIPLLKRLQRFGPGMVPSFIWWTKWKVFVLNLPILSKLLLWMISWTVVLILCCVSLRRWKPFMPSTGPLPLLCQQCHITLQVEWHITLPKKAIKSGSNQCMTSLWSWTNPLMTYHKWRKFATNSFHWSPGGAMGTCLFGFAPFMATAMAFT